MLHRWMILLLIAGSASFCVVASGCGNRKKVVPVSGVVTLDDQPLAGASISFNPVGKSRAIDKPAGVGSYGKTNAEGRFTLKTIDDDTPGAVIGQHKIFITTNEDTDEMNDATGQLLGERVPEPWRNGGKTFTIPEGGTDQANFHIEGDLLKGTP